MRKQACQKHNLHTALKSLVHALILGPLRLVKPGDKLRGAIHTEIHITFSVVVVLSIKCGLDKAVEIDPLVHLFRKI